MSGSNKIRWIAIALLALFSYGSVAVAADVKTSLAAGDAGKIYFNSAEKDTTYGQLYKHAAAFDDPIWGELRFPSNMTTDKVPVMVVMHSSAGINKNIYAWVDYFNKMGVATFMVDSFTPRGIEKTTDDQSQLNQSVTSADTPEELRAYFESCVSRGITVGGDPVYREKSRQEVKDFVTKNFGLGG
jgi:hypothetical protein